MSRSREPAQATEAPSPQIDRPAAASGRPIAPWLVQNPRMAITVPAVVLVAASPFAFRCLQSEFGPDPLAGIKVDAVKFDALTGSFEVVKPAGMKPVDVEPVPVKPAAAPAAVVRDK